MFEDLLTFLFSSSSLGSADNTTAATAAAAASSLTPICYSGLLDGNDNFGGMPYAAMIVLLTVSPIVYILGSACYWQKVKRISAMNDNSRGSNAVAAATNNGNNNSSRVIDMNYNSLANNVALLSPSPTSSSSSQLPSSSSSMSSSSSSSSLPSASPEPSPSSAITVMDSDEDSPSPSPPAYLYSSDASTLFSPSPVSSSPTDVPLLSSSSPSSSSLSLSSTSSSSSASSSYRITPSFSFLFSPASAYLSTANRFVFVCHLVTQPASLFTLTLVSSLVRSFLSVSTLIYVVFLSQEACCSGCTGTYYVILCLQLVLSYLCVRIAAYQTAVITNPFTANASSSPSPTVVPLSNADKSANIGYLIHFVWFGIAFLGADTGDCVVNAPALYYTALFQFICTIIPLLCFLSASAVLAFFPPTSDLSMITLRTICKWSSCGWSYGNKIFSSPNTSITSLEMEIACIPCISGAEMKQRELEKQREKQMLLFGRVSEVVVKSEDGSSTDENKKQHDNCCSICLTAYEDDDVIRPLACGHYLHKSCSDTWLKVKTTCPLCVRSVLVW